MTGFAAWIRPPRMLLLILFLFAATCISALAWFGWTVIEQDRLVEAQRSQEWIEQGADRLAESIRGTLAEAGDRLAAWTGVDPAPVPGGLVLTFTEQTVSANPPLLFYPTEAADSEAPADTFAEAEQIEFSQSDPTHAEPLYRKLAESTHPGIRAGALVRLARTLRNTQRTSEAIAVYEHLLGISNAKIAGVPASAVASHAIAELARRAEDAVRLRRGLSEGRWHLTRGQFEFYWDETRRLLGDAPVPSADKLMLADAAAEAWARRKEDSTARGQQTLWIGGKPFLEIWRGPVDKRTLLVAKPEKLLGPAQDGMRWALLDQAGHTVAGTRLESKRIAVRAAGPQLPWTLYISTDRPDGYWSASHQRFLLWGLASMVLFLLAGTYFIARAMMREAAMQRMQADFVAAVSHEFRSPLTSLRQLSEMLVAGRVPGEDRRKLYYETLLAETTRLQRLVESLLNFGQMEAGARQYRFEEIDANRLVERVVGEFPDQSRIQLLGSSDVCCFAADPDAIAVALRNLVDNALKYSPNDAPIRLEWNSHDGLIEIRVTDHGPGIAVSERSVIFEKFVRGAAAASTNAKGSGVGLAMVRHIVAANKGSLRLETELGKGSSFIMTFKASAPTRTDIQEPVGEWKGIRL